VSVGQINWRDLSRDAQEVLVGDEAFAAEKPLKYTATLNKTGTAK
jgi:hypothetical protein